MSKSKIYARIPVTEDEFKLFRGMASKGRAEMFDAWSNETDPDKKAFYAKRVDEYDALLRDKFDKVLIADKSQDADPDSDE